MNKQETINIVIEIPKNDRKNLANKDKEFKKTKETINGFLDDYLSTEFNTYYDDIIKIIDMDKLQIVLNNMIIVMEDINIEHLSYKVGKYTSGLTGKKHEGVEIHMKFKIDDSLCFNDKWVYSMEGIIRDNKMNSIF